MTGELLALAAMTMFASNTIVTRVATTKLATGPGYLIAVAVNIAVAAAVFGVELLLRGEPLYWSMAGFVFFVLAGLFSTYLGRWFVIESIVRLGPAKTSAFQISSPLFTFVLALALLGERLSPQATGGMLLAGVGLLLVSLSGSRPGGGAKKLAASAVAMALGSSAAYAVGNVMRGAAIREWNEPVLGALVGAVTGLLLLFVFSSERASMVRGLADANRSGVWLFVLSGVLTITAQIVLIAAMRNTPVAVVALITLCTPLVVFPASYFLLGNEEGMSMRTVAGGVLTLAGIALILLR